mgnify:CR=1 FL=1|tara:strand:- start:550 stop:1440 length:891 start_codon:yes stop_codon:yes gene_type:complete
MNDKDSRLIFENYYNARKHTLNEGLLDAIKNKFKDFSADVIKPYAIKAMQFIAKKNPQMAKQISQAVKNKDINSLKNILKPGIDELSKGAEVSTEDLQTIRNFLNTGLGKGIAGAIMALAAFTVVTGGIGGEDINADGTIDTVTVDDGDASTLTLSEFEQMMKDAGISVFDDQDDINDKMSAKQASAAEIQNPKASQDIGYPESGGIKKGETFDDYLERMTKDDPDYSKMTPDEIASHSMKQTLKTTQSLLDQMGKTIDSMDPSAPENKKFSDDFDQLLKQAQELFKKTGATKTRG